MAGADSTALARERDGAVLEVRLLAPALLLEHGLADFVALHWKGVRSGKVNTLIDRHLSMSCSAASSPCMEAASVPARRLSDTLRRRAARRSSAAEVRAAPARCAALPALWPARTRATPRRMRWTTRSWAARARLTAWARWLPARTRRATPSSGPRRARSRRRWAPRAAGARPRSIP